MAGRHPIGQTRDWDFGDPHLFERIEAVTGLTAKACGTEFDFSKRTYFGLKEVATGKDPFRKISLKERIVAIWRERVLQSVDEELAAELQWDRLLKRDGGAKPFDQNPRNAIPVALVQTWANNDLHRDIELAFLLESVRRDWRPSIFRSRTGSTGAVDAISQAARENHLLVTLPPLSATSTMRDVAKSGKAIVVSGFDEVVDRVWCVSVTPESYGWAIAAVMKDAKQSYTSVLCVHGDSKICQQRMAEVKSLCPSMTALELGNETSVQVNSDRVVAELTRLRRNPSTNSSPRVAVVPVDRTRTFASICALERLNWPDGLHLLSTDMSADWLRVFDCRQTWKGSVVVDPSLLIELATSILNIKARWPQSSLLKGYGPVLKTSCLAVTRTFREQHQDLSALELISTLFAKHRRELNSTYPWLRLSMT